MASPPFYADWKFWSVVVSLVAIALSQLPPVHIMLRRAKLDIDVYSRIVINHKVGNPNAQLHLILSNIGGRILKIRSISLRFRRGIEDDFTLPAQNYFQQPADKESVLLTSFKLKPNDEWGHVVNFLNLFSRTEDKEYRKIESDLRNDILNKLNVQKQLEEQLSQDDPIAKIDRTIHSTSSDYVIASDDKVQPALAFFDKKFRWMPGEYSMTLEVKAEPPSASITKQFRVTIFETDSNELREFREDYKYGAGIYFDIPKHSGLILPLSNS